MKNAHTPGNSPVRIQKLMLKLHLKKKKKKHESAPAINTQLL
jgi:hypothetical protein